MRKRILAVLLVSLLSVGLMAGCASPKPTSGYEQITQTQAKALMDSEKDYVILDVRTEDEFASGHIEGAVLIPDYDIGKSAESVLTNKDQLILVYCRSGRRSKNAASELAAMGYTNIKEFGGINTWEYGIVTE